MAFGDHATASVATLGINPSAREFIEDGALLIVAARRLASLESLRAENLHDLTEDQVATVVNECSTYFQRQPYRRWFDPLDDLLQASLGVSYYDGSACHLDLVQWATDPVWGKIGDRAVQRELLSDGVPHLRAQLRNENVRLVVMNGRQVIEHVLHAKLVTLTEVGALARSVPALPSARLFEEVAENVRWVGWSLNLQSSPGVSREDRRQLGRWLIQWRNRDDRE